MRFVDKDTTERRFILLGVLLQTLHPLFGVTAILGVFLNVARLPYLENEIWRDHCRWQIATFFIAAPLYAVTLSIGFSADLWWPWILAVMGVAYRIITSAVGVATQSPVMRLMRTGPSR